MNTKIIKKRIIMITVLVLVCILVTSSFISYAKFRVANPFLTGMALVKVMFTDVEYVEVQQYPKVIIAKPDNAETNLVDYMKNKGFNEDESNRMGALMRFENEIASQYVLYSVNGYFSKWIWRE